jgi:hypothetical protein
MRNFGVCCMALLLGIVSGIGYEITVVDAQDALAYLESTKNGVLDSDQRAIRGAMEFQAGAGSLVGGRGNGTHRGGGRPDAGWGAAGYEHTGTSCAQYR